MINGQKGKFFFVKSVELGEWTAGIGWWESVKTTDHIPTMTNYDEGV